MTVQLPRDAQLLRIFVGERDHCQGRPLYDAIVSTAYWSRWSSCA